MQILCELRTDESTKNLENFREKLRYFPRYRILNIVEAHNFKVSVFTRLARLDREICNENLRECETERDRPRKSRSFSFGHKNYGAIQSLVNSNIYLQYLKY